MGVCRKVRWIEKILKPKRILHLKIGDMEEWRLLQTNWMSSCTRNLEMLQSHSIGLASPLSETRVRVSSVTKISWIFTCGVVWMMEHWNSLNLCIWDNHSGGDDMIQSCQRNSWENIPKLISMLMNEYLECYFFTRLPQETHARELLKVIYSLMNTPYYL